MANTFPYGLAKFWDFIPIEAITRFELVVPQRPSVDGAGNTILTRLGDPRWEIDVRFAPRYMTDMVRFEAMINLLILRDGTFQAYDLRRAYPIEDPSGSLISGYSPLVRSIGSDNRSMSFKSMRGSYTLNVGDRFSVLTATSQRLLFEIQESVTTSGSTSTEVEISPPLPPGIAVNDDVDFTKPAGKFKIKPGTYRPSGLAGNTSSGLSFTAYSVAT